MENQNIFDELNACFALCNICFTACLKEENINQLAKCIQLGRECADTCQFTVSLLTRDSKDLDKFLGICAEICNACAEECEKHEYDHCRKCAIACRKCAETCLVYQLND